MTKAPKNVVASVLARLRNVAQEGGISFNDILQSYVIERSLARLSRSPHAEDTVFGGSDLPSILRKEAPSWTP